MFARRLGVGHGSLLWFTSTRTAFAPPGPGAFPFPDFSAPIRSTDSLVSFGLGYGLPLPLAYLGAGACSLPLVPASRGGTERRRVITGSPVPPDCSEEKRGPPRLRGRPHVARAVASHPAGFQAALAHFGRLVVAFEQFSTLGTRYVIDFVAAFPTAHALVCLRFAGRVTAPVARLTTGSGGLTPGQAGFAPAGRLTKFLELFTSFDPS